MSTADEAFEATAALDLAADVDQRKGVGGGRRRIHPAWWVAVVAFVALLGAAGFRAAPGVLMVPLEEEFGWPRTLISSAVSVNLVLYGLMAPFAAALMDRFGIRQVTSFALLLVAAGSGLTIFVHPGLAAGAHLGPADRARHRLDGHGVRGDRRQPLVRRRRGLVMGILTAAGATGQLIFLPVMATLAERHGWRAASLAVTFAALAVVPFVIIVLRDYPGRPRRHRRTARRRAGRDRRPSTGRSRPPGDRALWPTRARTRTFWALAGGFAICGATTNGLIGTHFVPSAHDHGMPETTAAGLLAAGRHLRHRRHHRLRRAHRPDRPAAPAGRLLLLPRRRAAGAALAALGRRAPQHAGVHHHLRPGLGGDRAADRRAVPRGFGTSGTIVFGWVFASHQIGAAVASAAAGIVRDTTGDYTIAWFGGAGLCLIAAVVSVTIRGRQRSSA